MHESGCSWATVRSSTSGPINHAQHTSWACVVLSFARTEVTGRENTGTCLLGTQVPRNCKGRQEGASTVSQEEGSGRKSCFGSRLCPKPDPAAAWMPFSPSSRHSGLSPSPVASAPAPPLPSGSCSLFIKQTVLQSVLLQATLWLLLLVLTTATDFAYTFEGGNFGTGSAGLVSPREGQKLVLGTSWDCWPRPEAASPRARGLEN